MTFPPGACIISKLELHRNASPAGMEKSRSLVERARLEIVYTPKGYRGFESPLLRQKIVAHESGPRFFEVWGFEGRGVRKRAGGTFSPRPGPSAGGRIPPSPPRRKTPEDDEDRQAGPHPSVRGLSPFSQKASLPFGSPSNKVAAQMGGDFNRLAAGGRIPLLPRRLRWGPQ